MQLQPHHFMDARETIVKHRVHLPHWQQGRVLQFVTWNMGDALPSAKRRALQHERNLWLRSHPKPWTSYTQREFTERFLMRWEHWLDQGNGSCMLKRPDISMRVASALFHFHMQRYELNCFVIMPNHVHVLFSPYPDFEVDRILHSWKSYTSHKLSTQWNLPGPFWMKDYWDRMIRDLEHYDSVRKYIRTNPTKAKLKEGEYVLWMGPRDEVSPT